MTFLLETIRLGLSNLRLHLLRSVLTALGIILGVGAVIIMSSLGEGSKREALAQIERLGARNIIVRSQRPPESQTQQGGGQRSFVSRFGITRATLGVIEENFIDAETIVPLKEVGGQILRNERRKTSQAFGTTPDLLDVAKLSVDRGRYLNDGDMRERAMVCVIGTEVAKDFFPLEDPLGQTLRIDSTPFIVVGVLSPVGLAGGAGATLIGRDFNLDIHIPMTAAREAFGDTVVRGSSGNFQANATEVSEIIITSRDRENVMSDASRLRRLMEVRHPGLAGHSRFSLILSVFPTLHCAAVQVIAATDLWQMRLVGGRLDCVTAAGRLALEDPLPLNRWTEVALTLDSEGLMLRAAGQQALS